MALGQHLSGSVFVFCIATIFLERSFAKNKTNDGLRIETIKHGYDGIKEAKTVGNHTESNELGIDLADFFHRDMHDTGGKDFDFKNNSEILDSPSDDDDEWEQSRPLPRSKVLIHAYLKMHNVVPEVIPRAPKDALEVTYKKDEMLDFGNELVEKQVSEIPIKTTWPVEKGSFYTLIFFTPDSPARSDQSEGQFLLWLVANINDSCLPQSGKTYVDYLGPKPWSKFHALLGELRRYIFIVYKQPNKSLAYKVKITHKDSMDSRKHFNVTKLVAEYNLGQPVAANMFQMVTIRQKRDWAVKSD